MAEDQIQEIKDKIDSVSLISEYLPLKRAGKNYKALCPFHQEKTPSFMVSPELQIFKCFGCGKGGDVFTFLKEMEGMEFKETLEYLAKRAGVELKRYQKTEEDIRKERLLQLHQLAGEVYHHLLTSHKLGKRAYNYLKERGITDKSTEIFQLGYAPDSWESLGNYFLSKKYTLSELLDSGLGIAKEGGRRFYDRFRGRVMFPLKNFKGQIVGFSGRSLTAEEPKYINSPETLIFSKSSILFGFDLTKSEIKKQKNAVVVEGLFDVITPYQVGVRNVVASLGTALTPSQIKLLSRVADSITFCFDTDKAGDEATKRGIKLAQQNNLNIRVAILPIGKDPDESIREAPQAFKSSLEKAVPITDFYFESSFKMHNPKTALGKKRLGQELLPIITAISDPLEKDHYVNQLATRLEVSSETIQKALYRIEKEGEDISRSHRVNKEILKDFSTPKVAVEEYILASILKAPLEMAQSTLRKLSQSDFTDETRINLFVELKKYLIARKHKFDIKTFRAKLGDKEQRLVDELYLWDLGDDLSLLEEELERTFKLVRGRSIRRSLRVLSGKIKQAERNKDIEKLKTLQKQFQALSEKLK